MLASSALSFTALGERDASFEAEATFLGLVLSEFNTVAAAGIAAVPDVGTVSAGGDAPPVTILRTPVFSASRQARLQRDF